MPLNSTIVSLDECNIPISKEVAVLDESLKGIAIIECDEDGVIIDLPDGIESDNDSDYESSCPQKPKIGWECEKETIKLSKNDMNDIFDFENCKFITSTYVKFFGKLISKSYAKEKSNSLHNFAIQVFR